MDFNYMPSLERICSIKVVTIVWGNHLCHLDTARQIEDFFHKMVRLRAIEIRVSNDLSSLIIPDMFKTIMKDFVRPIGHHLLMWKENENRFYQLDVPYPNTVYWTAQGILDRKKTAEMMVNDESLGNLDRYKIACIYCIEDVIPVLWNNMSENLKRSIFQSTQSPDGLAAFYNSELTFWTYYVTGYLNAWENFIFEGDPTRWWLQIAIRNANLTATKYFFNRSSIQSRRILVGLAEYAAMFCIFYLGFGRFNNSYLREQDVFYTEVLHFLISNLDPDQIQEFIGMKTTFIIAFLEWPWQPYIMPLAEQAGEFLGEDIFEALLCNLLHKNIVFKFNDYDYRTLFGQMWNNSTTNMKNFIIGKCISNNICWRLFEAEDVRSLRLLFDYATVSQKEDIIFSDECRSLCRDLVHQEKYTMLDFLIRQCLTTRNSVDEFRRNIQRYIELLPPSVFDNYGAQFVYFVSLLHNLYEELE